MINKGNPEVDVSKEKLKKQPQKTLKEKRREKQEKRNGKPGLLS